MLSLAIAVLIGSQTGAHVMTTRMKPRQLKQMFGLALLFVEAKLICFF